MKRAELWMAMVVVAASVGGLAGCTPDEGETSYDPRLDGIMPRTGVGEEPGILDDQKKKVRPKATVTTPAATAPTTAPGTRPAVTPPPPPE